MSDITVADWVQIAILASSLIAALLGLLNRWAVANKKDQLAAFTSGAANTASRINQIVAELPPTATSAALKAQLIKQGADALLKEFGPLAPKTATPLKTEALILGQYGQLPAPALVGVAEDAANVKSVVAALNGDVVVNSAKGN